MRAELKICASAMKCLNFMQLLQLNSSAFFWGGGFLGVSSCCKSFSILEFQHQLKNVRSFLWKSFSDLPRFWNASFKHSKPFLALQPLFDWSLVPGAFGKEGSHMVAHFTLSDRPRHVSFVWSLTLLFWMGLWERKRRRFLLLFFKQMLPWVKTTNKTQPLQQLGCRNDLNTLGSSHGNNLWSFHCIEGQFCFFCCAAQMFTTSEFDVAIWPYLCRINQEARVSWLQDAASTQKIDWVDETVTKVKYCKQEDTFVHHIAFPMNHSIVDAEKHIID